MRALFVVRGRAGVGHKKRAGPKSPLLAYKDHLIVRVAPQRCPLFSDDGAKLQLFFDICKFFGQNLPIFAKKCINIAKMVKIVCCTRTIFVMAAPYATGVSAGLSSFFVPHSCIASGYTFTFT